MVVLVRILILFKGLSSYFLLQHVLIYWFLMWTMSAIKVLHQETWVLQSSPTMLLLWNLWILNGLQRPDHNFSVFFRKNATDFHFCSRNTFIPWNVWSVCVLRFLLRQKVNFIRFVETYYQHIFAWKHNNHLHIFSKANIISKHNFRKNLYIFCNNN